MAENNPNPTEQQEGTPAEKTFTQADVDAIVSKRLAKAMKNVPSEEELTAYRSWKESQQTEQQKIDKLKTDYNESKTNLEKANAEIERLKRSAYVQSKGFTGDEAEFIAFKAAKMVDDKTTFEKAVDSIAETRKKVKFDWTAPVGAGAKESGTNNAMNDIIRSAFK